MVKSRIPTRPSHVALLVRSVNKTAEFLRRFNFKVEQAEEWDGEGTKEIYVDVYQGVLGSHGLKGRIVVGKNGVKIWDTGDISGNFVKSQNFQNVMISFGCSSSSIAL